MNDSDDERVKIEQERLRLERLRFLLAIDAHNLNVRAQRRANRSWYDKLEDTLFDW